MSLLREITKRDEEEEAADDAGETSSGPVTPEDGWSVGHLANHGMLLSCDGFTLKLDIDQLNKLFDLAEDGESGEIKDHAGEAVYVEVDHPRIILSRNNDDTYPEGVVLDAETLKEMGIEQHEQEREQQPEKPEDKDAEGDTMDNGELEEGIDADDQPTKKSRGFKITSDFRKGQKVAAELPKTKTRIKPHLASRGRRIVRLLRGRRTPASKKQDTGIDNSNAI
jgi:hypothetical protein